MRANRAGTAAVEFALVAPVLCLIMLGMLEIGRAVQVQMELTNAVREGCRGYADSTVTLTSGYQTGTSTYAQYLVTDSLSNAGCGIDTSKVTVTTSTSQITVAGATLTQVSVTATLPYSSIAYFPAFIMTGKNLTATLTMKKSS